MLATNRGTYIPEGIYTKTQKGHLILQKIREKL